MAKQRKAQGAQNGRVSVSDIELRAADGTPVRSISGNAVVELRHMVSRLSCEGGLPPRLALTSALRQEGVTTMTLALGATIASDLELRVCVMELNWYWPRMFPPAQGAQATPRPGSAEVLAGTAELDEVLVATELPRLTLLPAGNLAAEQRPAAARSAALAALVGQLGERFDLLLLDVPAVLATSDALHLAGLAGHCCLVVRHGVTPTLMVRQALDDIRTLTMLGVVLNQVQLATPAWMRRLIPQE